MENFRAQLAAVDWPLETARALWAQSGAPGMAVIDNDDGVRLWVSGHNWIKDMIPGGGSDYTETTEYIIGSDGLTGLNSDQHFVASDVTTLEGLFELFFSGCRAELVDKLERLTTTDVYV